jgi:iron complex transport system ATP-binding protein
VTFAADSGRLTSIVGPNGSGKSTIVRALLRQMRPESGEVQVDGVSLAHLSRNESARRIAIVSQREEPVFPLSVRDYVSMGRLPFQSRWKRAPADDAEVVRAALSRTGMSRFEDRFTDQLSGGEWQLVRIARALAQQCHTLVLDEPTTFLDIGHEMAVFELARALADEGRTVVLVSHQINLVARFSDVMVMLHLGRLVATGSPQQVMRGDLLESVYEWPMVVSRDPASGAPALVPLRKA